MTINANKDSRLCRIDELDDPDSREFYRDLGGYMLDFFVVRKRDRVTAYVNSCPHTGAPLNWSPDDFLDSSRRVIQCATHDARFRIEDGLCLAGPCVGDFLKPVSVRVDDGWVVLGDSGGDSSGG